MTTAAETAVVAARFRGPDGVGNGGTVAGRLAELLGGGPAEVTLRRGWPLDVPLTIHRGEGRVRAVDAAGAPIAEAVALDALDVPHPPVPPPDAAARAARWFLDSPFSHSDGLCFTCGSARPPGDGLRVFTGCVEGRPDLVAGLWRPDMAFADPATGRIRPEFLWAALDCAGSFAFTVPAGAPGRMLLGRMAARLDGAVAAGERCTVTGWPIARDGRKLTAGTAVFGEDGGQRAIARSVWITPASAA